MRLVLYQPDIPQNAGTIMRMAACLGVAVDLIEPAGFDASDRNFRRAGMDYLDHLEIARHVSFEAFETARRASRCRLLLATSSGGVRHTDFSFNETDSIMVGRESAGVPPRVHAAADATLRVPIRHGLRSLNVAVAAAIILGEALRQTSGFDA